MNYLAPIVDEDFEIQTRAVGPGRSNQHWFVELSQNGDVKTTATAVFGVRRETWADTGSRTAGGAEVPTGTGSQNANPLGVVWLETTTSVSSKAPFRCGPAPSSSSRTVMWVEDNPARQLDFASLAAVCDIFYPRVYLRRGQLMPAGTISFTVYFHADQGELADHGDDFVLGTARAQRFAAGHFDQTAQIWSRSGGLLAATHQLVYYKG